MELRGNLFLLTFNLVLLHQKRHHTPPDPITNQQQCSPRCQMLKPLSEDNIILRLPYVTLSTSYFSPHQKVSLGTFKSEHYHPHPAPPQTSPYRHVVLTQHVKIYSLQTKSYSLTLPN
jgi:hypothetical protein